MKLLIRIKCLQKAFISYIDFNIISKPLSYYTKIILLLIMPGLVLLGCNSLTNQSEKINHYQIQKVDSDNHVTSTLQLISETGDVLSFSRNSLLIASKNYMINLELVDAQVDPIIDDKDQVSNKADTIKKQFEKVSYPNAWPGITVVYESKPEQLIKSSYYIQAHTSKNNLDKIAIRYNRPIRINSKGQLIISLEQGELIESAPIAWQVIGRERKAIDVAYHLKSKNTVGFFVGNYDPAYELVIDPSLEWNTFQGSSGPGDDDYGRGITVDTSGNVYITGYSENTWGSPIRVYTSFTDVFVTKLDNNGNLLWSTFLGGSGNDLGGGIAVDTSSNVFVSGYSDATWATPVRSYTSGNDNFVAKLDSDGNLIWNTFLGGGASDAGRDIAVDLSNNVYVTGDSSASWGTPLRSFLSSVDPYVAKLDSNGNLLWNTFVGSGGNDSAASITTDPSGNNYVCGMVGATWGSPVRAYTSSFDTFVVKLDSNGTIIWNTFLGGSGSDVGNGIILDNDGNVFVGGESYATWETPIRAYSSNGDPFAAKLDNNGNLIWNTFLGGSGIDSVNGIAVDTIGSAYLGGQSNATWGTPIRPYTSSSDGYVAMVDNNGNLIWNAFLGGTSFDGGEGVAVDLNGNAFVVGLSTGSWGSPIRAYGSAYDSFVAKIKSDVPTLTPTAIMTQTPPTMTRTVTPSITSSNRGPLISDIRIYPNPFRPSSQKVVIQYKLFENAAVTVTIYSYLGTKITTIKCKAGEEGGLGNSLGVTNQLTWDGRNAHGLLQATGGYICQIVTKSKLSHEQSTLKIGLIR